MVRSLCIGTVYFARMTAFPCILYQRLQVQLDGHYWAVRYVADMLRSLPNHLFLCYVHAGGSCLESSSTAWVAHDLWHCSCAAGFSDIYCNTNVQECTSTPCRNNGTCTDGVAAYACSNCGAGYSGVNCEVELDECGSSPCQNGARCVDMVFNFTCVCPDGWNGDRCHQNIDDCSSIPCQNGASCIDGVDDFSCTCPSGPSHPPPPVIIRQVFFIEGSDVIDLAYP